MRYKTCIVVAGSLLALWAGAASAEDRNFVVWDEAIAASISERLADEGRCSASPEAVYGERCQARLNLGFERPVNYFTFIDRVALLAYKYHQIKYNQSIWDNTKLKFSINLKNVYKQEARARVELRIRFSSNGPSFDLPVGSALQRPSFAAAN